MSLQKPEGVFHDTLDFTIYGQLNLMQLYGARKVRTATNNRVRNIVRRIDKDIPLNAVEAKKDDETKRKEAAAYNDTALPGIIKQLKTQHKLPASHAKHLIELTDTFQSNDMDEKILIDNFKIFGDEVIYQEYYRHIKGLGKILMPQIFLKIHYAEKFESPAHLWAFFGFYPPELYDVRKKAKKLKEGQLDFSPENRALMYVLGQEFIKSKSPYRTFYDSYKESQLALLLSSHCKTCGAHFDEDLKSEFHKKHIFSRNPKTIKDGEANKKHRFEPDVPHSALCVGHANNRALRYMMKCFLLHHWVIGRTLYYHHDSSIDAGANTWKKGPLTHGYPEPIDFLESVLMKDKP